MNCLHEKNKPKKSLRITIYQQGGPGTFYRCRQSHFQSTSRSQGCVEETGYKQIQPHAQEVQGRIDVQCAFPKEKAEKELGQLPAAREASPSARQGMVRVGAAEINRCQARVENLLEHLASVRL